jgi:D-alanyl-D-alanine dipeptidase
MASIKNILTCALALPLFLMAPAVLAQQNPSPPGGWQPSIGAVPATQLITIDIPTIKFTDILMKEEMQGGKTIKTINVPWMAQYISGVYKYAVSIAGVIAAVMMMIGGIQYLTAGGDAGRVSRGKERINDALLGLMLVLGTYMVLQVINPDLVKMQGTLITLVAPEKYPPSTAGATDEVEKITGATASSGEMASPPGDNIFGPGKGKVPKELAQKVQAAALLLKPQGCALIITDGFRSFDEQVAIINGHCTNPPGSCNGCKAKPGQSAACTLCGMKRESCPHTTGQAVDAWGAKLTGGKPGFADPFEGKKWTQTCPKESNCTTKEPCVAAARKAMRDSGFCLWSGESWHFEVSPGFSKPCN